MSEFIFMGKKCKGILIANGKVYVYGDKFFNEFDLLLLTDEETEKMLSFLLSSNNTELPKFKFGNINEGGGHA